MRDLFFGPLIDDVENSIRAQQGEKWDRELFEKNLMGYSMRTDRYRFVVWKDVKHPDKAPVDLELYDERSDPAETRNIASENPEIVKNLLEQFNEGWRGNLPGD